MNIEKRKFTTKYPSPPPETEPEPNTLNQNFGKNASFDNREKQSNLLLQSPFIYIKKKIRISRPALIISRVLLELDGRDKAMKMTQYAIKILLHYQIVYAKHWSLVTNQLSITRKLLRVGNVIRSYHRITTENTLTVYNTFVLCNTIVNQISDDIFCFYKLDLIGSYWGLRAELLASYCWLTNTILDILESKTTLKGYQKELISERSNDKMNHLKESIFISKISLLKLFMDAIFCGKSLDIYLQNKKSSVIFTFTKVCDIWKPSYSPVLQSWSGFISATMAIIKLWIKNSE